jgi:hypothetical protein
VLTVSLSSHDSKSEYGIADANYDPSDPLYLADGAYLKLTGSSFGRFEYIGHGHFHFDSTTSDEEVTVFEDDKALATDPVKGGGGFADITCSATSFTTTVTFGAASKSVIAVEVWRRRSG